MDSHNPANVIQLTEAGNVGSSSSRGAFQDILFGSGNAFGIRWAKYGNFAAGNYNIIGSSGEFGATAAAVGNTEATITMVPGMVGTTYAVFSTVNKSGTGANAGVAHYSLPIVTGKL